MISGDDRVEPPDRASTGRSIVQFGCRKVLFLVLHRLVRQPIVDLRLAAVESRPLVIPPQRFDAVSGR
jgi:hypothetical protein